VLGVFIVRNRVSRGIAITWGWDRVTIGRGRMSISRGWWRVAISRGRVGICWLNRRICRWMSIGGKF